LRGAGVPLSEPKTSTPLADADDADDGEGGDAVGDSDVVGDRTAYTVPNAALWAMKFHRHHVRHPAENAIRTALGTGDGAVYFIDDGLDRCMVGRIVGHSPDGCTYALVGNADVGTFWRFRDDGDPVTEAFSDCRPLHLCAVYDGGVDTSNVVDVQRFRHSRDVPADYLPPSPPIEFEEPL
jgi:hypothetical protein